MAVSSRLGALRSQLQEFSVLLVSSLTNIRYLSGFTGSAGLLAVGPDKALLVTDGRYETQAAEQLTASGAPVELEVAGVAGQRQALARFVDDLGCRRMGLEAGNVTWARLKAFQEEWFPGVELVPSEGCVEALRARKDPGELDRMGEAARIADAALAKLLPRLGEGLSEASFGRLLDFEMRELGASEPSFETIVASGPNAAKPHHRPGGRTIEAGEAVVVDFGARFDGYCSDMTRTVWASKPPADAEMRRAISVVAQAQSAGVEAVRAGVCAADVDRVCRDVIADAGFAERFVHSTGHGVGLDIHEAPSVAAASGDTLEAGHVVTVEPGVYIPGVGGVRIEDTVVVTEDGCRPLTLSPKESI
jgi:Xaa-Pro aminopeptidase